MRQIKSEDHEGRPGQKQVVLRSKREAGLKQASTTYIAAKVSGDTCVLSPSNKCTYTCPFHQLQTVIRNGTGDEFVLQRLARR